MSTIDISKIEKIITYNYNEFGTEFGDALLDLKNENIRLNNIIDELEKFLNDYVKLFKDNNFRDELLFVYAILDKLNELKGDNK